jgi:hypothetical protein
MFFNDWIANIVNCDDISFILYESTIYHFLELDI